MKLDIYELIKQTQRLEYNNNNLKITLIKEEYISEETFIKNIKTLIDNIGSIPDKIHYNEDEINIYYNEYSNIGFD